MYLGYVSDEKNMAKLTKIKTCWKGYSFDTINKLMEEKILYFSKYKNKSVSLTPQGEEYFYSIFDDCFFRLFPSKDEITDNLEKYSNKIFADVYDRNHSFMKSPGLCLYERLQKKFITKQEILENRDFLGGYFSDLDYELLKIENDIDYSEPSTILHNLINTELEYEQKLNRPIKYTDGITPPSATKRLIKSI